MKFLEKINNFNQYISFHIFAFAGWVALLIEIYLKITYNRELQSYGNVSTGCGDAFAWLSIYLNVITLIFFVIAFIIFNFEIVFSFKIKNKFLVENIFLKIIRYIGAILSLIYLSLLFVFLFYGFVILPFVS